MLSLLAGLALVGIGVGLCFFAQVLSRGKKGASAYEAGNPGVVLRADFAADLFLTTCVGALVLALSLYLDDVPGVPMSMIGAFVVYLAALLAILLLEKLPHSQKTQVYIRKVASRGVLSLSLLFVVLGMIAAGLLPV